MILNACVAVCVGDLVVMSGEGEKALAILIFGLSVTVVKNNCLLLIGWCELCAECFPSLTFLPVVTNSRSASDTYTGIIEKTGS